MARLIDKMLECLPEVRRTFYARGFDLPQSYLRAIESMRVRDGQERDYQHYLDQVLLEYAGLKYPWQPRVRAGLKPEDRSGYLDMLAERSAGVATAASLDPNYSLFVKLDSVAWQDLLKEFRMQKQVEAERHSSELADAISIATGQPISMLLRIAERQGYRSNRKVRARDDVLELKGPADSPIGMSLRVVDLPSLEKRGDVVVQYFFTDLPNKPFGLDSFVPGGYLYSEWNQGMKASAFAFYAQCRFLSDLDEELGRRIRAH